jgi:hypothetical protein
MAVPASLFRPHGPTRLEPADPTPVQEPASLVIDVIEPPRHPGGDSATVEFDVRVSPGGDV